MRHKYADFIVKWADFIAKWAEDSESVQYRRINAMPPDTWLLVTLAATFDSPCVEFRITPKPKYRYYKLAMNYAATDRDELHNIKAEFIDGKLTAVELLVEGDNK